MFVFTLFSSLGLEFAEVQKYVALYTLHIIVHTKQHKWLIYIIEYLSTMNFAFRKDNNVFENIIISITTLNIFSLNITVLTYSLTKIS